jgi:uncharacterized membrane protein
VKALISEDCEEIIASPNFPYRINYCTFINITCPKYDYTSLSLALISAGGLLHFADSMFVTELLAMIEAV